MLQYDKRKKSYFEFGKSMKNYSIAKWVHEITNIILNFFVIAGASIYLLIFLGSSSINYEVFVTLRYIYLICMVLLILIYLVCALISAIYFIFYLVKLAGSFKYDQKENLKKSFILEIISIVLYIILPISLEILSFIISLIFPEHTYTFIIPNYEYIQYDFTYISLKIAIILFALRIINGYIPRILKAIAQKKFLKWTDDLFECPDPSSEHESLEPSIFEGSKSMKVGQILRIFRIVRIFGKIMYILGLGKTGKGLMKSFENYKIKNQEVISPTVQQKNMYANDETHRFCAYCGSRLINNSKFCGKCGESIL